MPKTTIHCVRHAQGYHNLSIANHNIPDPELTPFGIEQCAALNKAFPYHSRITHLVASPLRRTLNTCLLSFPSEVKAGKQVIALPSIQETSDLPCDTGSSVHVLASEFPAEKVDLTNVYEDWNSKKGKYSPASSAIEARAREARIFLRDLAARAAKEGSVGEDGNVDIAVVTHGGFLHYFTEDWDGCEKFTGTGWENTEFRSYEFVDAGKELDPDASLKETRESRKRRGVGTGDENGLSVEEQRNLRQAAEREWQESGYQTPPEEANGTDGHVITNGVSEETAKL